MPRIQLFLVSLAFITGGCTFSLEDAVTPVSSGKAGAPGSVVEKPVPEPVDKPELKPTQVPLIKPDANPVRKPDDSNSAILEDPVSGSDKTAPDADKQKPAGSKKQNSNGGTAISPPPPPPPPPPPVRATPKNGSGSPGNSSGSIVINSSSGKSGNSGYSGITGAIGSVTGSVTGSISSGDTYTFYPGSGSSNYSISPDANVSDSTSIVITPDVTIGIGDLNLSLPDNGESSAESEDTSRPVPAQPEPEPKPESVTRNNLDSYSVIVAADREITIPGPPGEMRVWIGGHSAEPTFDTDRKSVGQKDIPALSDTAKVTPYTPGFEVKPKESICEKIVPSGSEVRFQLIPSETGAFSIGADVALYPSDDCTGTPIPKTAASVQVNVVVNTSKIIERSWYEILAETWKGVLGFWKEFIGLVSALILFLIRKKLYKWFGFKPGKED